MNQQPDNLLESILRELIAARGGIPFVEFMEHCLYHPDHGYYMTPRQRIGKSGDFYTSSSVHRLFGKLVARQLAQMADLLQGETFEIVEQGPGEGHLALDVLDTLAGETPELYERTTYTLVELSPDNRRRQADVLAGHTARIAWCEDADWSIGSGCFLSNELCDAFPVHLLDKHGGELREVFVVNTGNGGFAEELRPPTADVAAYFEWLGESPLAGSRAEANLHAPAWLRQIAGRIGRGFVITIDYGYPSAELYAPHRRGGTLMCYRHHQADDNPYAEVGEKDITAHIDFSALQKAGDEAGMATLWFGEQYRFLMALGFVEELIRLEASATDEKEARALRLTLKNLIMPESGMGETFKVLVQGKGVGAPELLCARPISAIPPV